MSGKGIKQARRNEDGLTPMERLVVTEWDAGLSLEQIAAKHCLTPDQVRSGASDLLRADEERLAKIDCQRGSAKLLAAMLAANQIAVVRHAG